MKKCFLAVGLVISLTFTGCSEESCTTVKECRVADDGVLAPCYNAAEFSYLSQLKDVETSLLSLSKNYHDAIMSNTEVDFEEHLSSMKSSKLEFDDRVGKLINFKCFDQKMMEEDLSEISNLFLEYSELTDSMPDIWRRYYQMRQKAKSRLTDFNVWLPVFRQMLLELRLKAPDDYVKNLILNFMTYQSQVEKKVYEALETDSADKVWEARGEIDALIEEYKKQRDNLYSEMPEAENEIGSLMSNFMYLCADRYGSVAATHEALVHRTKELTNQAYYEREILSRLKGKMTVVQIQVAYKLSNSKERMEAEYKIKVTALIVMLCISIFFVLTLSTIASVLYFKRR